MKHNIYYRDLGGQYSHLLLVFLKRMDIELVDTPDEADYIVISGSPKDSFDDKELLQLIKNSTVPVLGVCYGAQLLAYLNGGEIIAKSEYGPATVELYSDPSFSGLPSHITALMSHSNSIIGLENNIIAKTDSGPAAFRFGKNLALLFHPEVDTTEYGQKIIENFFDKNCKERNWEQFIEEKQKDVAAINDVFSIAFSGGVDSIVTSTLMSKLKVNITNFYVDMGIMPKTFRQRAESVGAVILEKKEELLKLLKNVTDGKTKRRIIGGLFIKAFSEVQKGTLVQGTIASDVVESGQNGKRATIKEHHNVGALPEGNFKIYEPLRELYKNDVRALGKYLKIKKEYLATRPFPGPGFACRIIGEVNEERLEVLSEATEIVDNLTENLDIWQIPVILLPVNTTNVRGDKSVIAPYAIVLRPVHSTDGMTAVWNKNILSVIDKITSVLLKNHKIGRVLLEVDSKPPSTIEWL